MSDKDKALYHSGNVMVPLWAIGGEYREILRPDGSVVCVVSESMVDRVLLELNTLLGEIV